MRENRVAQLQYTIVKWLQACLLNSLCDASLEPTVGLRSGFTLSFAFGV